MRQTSPIGRRSTISQWRRESMRYLGGGTTSWTTELTDMIGTFRLPRVRPNVRPDLEWTRLWTWSWRRWRVGMSSPRTAFMVWKLSVIGRSEEHTSELQSPK